MSVFHFKKFSIQQGETAMKVGTDGVLLGAWVDQAFEHSVFDRSQLTKVLNKPGSKIMEGVE